MVISQKVARWKGVQGAQLTRKDNIANKGDLWWCSEEEKSYNKEACMHIETKLDGWLLFDTRVFCKQDFQFLIGTYGDSFPYKSKVQHHNKTWYAV